MRIAYVRGRIANPPTILAVSLVGLVGMPTVTFLQQLLIRPHHFSGRSGDGGGTCLTAVEGKRLTVTVVLNDGWRRQRSSSMTVVARGGDSDRVGWSAGSLFDQNSQSKIVKTPEYVLKYT
jgi:hypothetical protein